MSVESTREVKRHYETLLAAHYAWMSGDLAQRVADAERYFRRNGITGPGRALDLGCGHGIQSIALARLGYHVTAVDFNTRLLADLKANAGDATIETVEADLLTIDQHSFTGTFDAVVCMGDTLTHLPTMSDVQRLIELAARRLLTAGGRMVLGLRDLTVELTGVDRALPVRLDPDRLMLAFLEYHAEHVRVHDLVLQRTGDQWRLEKNAYSKLRIAIDQLTSLLQQLGLNIESTSHDRGMYHIIARKPLECKANAIVEDCQRSNHMDHLSLIEQYSAAPEELRRAVSGMTGEQLDAKPIEGKWSTRQVVAHIADFEPIYVDRMKRVLAENQPTLFAGHPDVFAASLWYEQRDIDEELELIAASRRHMTRLLRLAAPEDFQRTGKHSETGPITLAQLLENIVLHIPHHIRFIEEKRRALA